MSQVITQEFVQVYDGNTDKLESKLNKIVGIVDSLNKQSTSIQIGSSKSVEDAAKHIADLNKNYGKLVNTIKNEKGLEKVIENANKLTTALNPLVDKLKSFNSEMNSASANKFGTSLKNLTKDVDELTKKLNKLKKENDNSLDGKKVKHWSDELKIGHGALGQMLNSIQRLIPFMSALFVVGGVGNFFSELYRVNKEFELFEIKSKAALDGSRTAVNYYYQSLKQIDIKSLFDIEELESGTLKALNRRLKFSKEELQSLANTAEAVGTKGAQSFNQIIEATLDAQQGQFRRLEELGIGIDAKGDKIKATFAGVTTEVDKGSQGIVRYILNLDKMNGAYKVAEESAGTLEGKVSSLKTRFDEFLIEINKGGGRNVFNFLIDSADGFILAMRNAIGFFKASFAPAFFIFDKIGKYNDGVNSRQNDNKLIANYGLKDDRGLKNKKDELFKTQNENILKLNKEFGSIDNFGEKYFNPSKINDNKLLKEYQQKGKLLIKQLGDFGLADNANFNVFVKQIDAIDNEIEARRLQSLDKSGEKIANKKERLAIDEENTQKRANEAILQGENDLKLMRANIELETQKERIRFLKQGSDEYLKLKEKIDLQELEIDKKKAKDKIREDLLKTSTQLVKDRKGNSRVVTTEPTSQQIDNEYNKENQYGFSIANLFNIREAGLKNDTAQALKSNADKEIQERKTLMEKLLDLVESSADREVKAIINKYGRIEKVVQELLLNTKDSAEKVFLEVTLLETKALEELEKSLLSNRKSQEGSVDKAKSSITKKKGESNSVYQRKVNIAGLKQELSNKQADEVTIKLRAKISKENGIDIVSTDNYKEILADTQNGITEIQTKLNNEIEKQKVEFSFSDSIILKAFGIDGQKNPEGTKKALEGIREAFGSLTDSYFSFIDGLIVIDKKREDAANSSITNLKNRLQTEEDLRRKGLANNYEAVSQDLQRQEALKKRAIDAQVKLQKLQIASNLVLQESNMAVALAETIKGAAAYGVPLGGILAGVQIAAMIGLFASSVAQMKSLDKYGDGGEIDGPSHSNGGVNINAEGGEHMIRKKSNIPNRRLVSNLNKIGEKISERNIHKLFEGTNLTYPSDNKDWQTTVANNQILHQYHIEQNHKLEEKIDKLYVEMKGVKENTGRLPSTIYTRISDKKYIVQSPTGTDVINLKDE